MPSIEGVLLIDLNDRYIRAQICFNIAGLLKNPVRVACLARRGGISMYL
jgi:hypothetical protein